MIAPMIDRKRYFNQMRIPRFFCWKS